MKVICIKEAKYNHVSLEERESPVKVGQPYHVLHQQVEFGILYYALVELGMDLGIEAKCFAPCSDIDEKDFVREYKKQTA